MSVKMSAWRVRVHRVDAVEAGGAVHAAAPPWRTSSVISAMKRGILREIVPRTHWITSNVTSKRLALTIYTNIRDPLFFTCSFLDVTTHSYERSCPSVGSCYCRMMKIPGFEGGETSN